MGIIEIRDKKEYGIILELSYPFYIIDIKLRNFHE